MPDQFICEQLKPIGNDFDTAGMSRGEPGLPGGFQWRGENLEIVEVIESWKERVHEHHTSGEKYTRKHWYRIRTTSGVVMNIYFERKMRTSATARWWIYTIET